MCILFGCSSNWLYIPITPYKQLCMWMCACISQPLELSPIGFNMVYRLVLCSLHNIVLWTIPSSHKVWQCKGAQAQCQTALCVSRWMEARVFLFVHEDGKSLTGGCSSMEPGAFPFQKHLLLTPICGFSCSCPCYKGNYKTTIIWFQVGPNRVNIDSNEYYFRSTLYVLYI